jgi:hypothetical protein
MRWIRNMALVAPLAFAVGCGGLENVPLTEGMVRGALVGAGAGSSVSVMGRPDLVDVPTQAELAALAHQPSTNWNFELAHVPEGRVELLILIASGRTGRLAVDVVGGAIEDLPPQEGQASGRLEAKLRAPSHQEIEEGVLKVIGTPIRRHIEETSEDLEVPAGCYSVEATVPGLGTVTGSGCVASGATQHVELPFLEPDGSPGREGCSVTGCQDEYHCSSDGRCRD